MPARGNFCQRRALSGRSRHIGRQQWRQSGDGAIAYAHSDFAVVIDNSIIARILRLIRTILIERAGGNGTVSGLFVTDGGQIILSVNGDGLIIGTVIGGAFNGKVAFAIAISSDGRS